MCPVLHPADTPDMVTSPRSTKSRTLAVLTAAVLACTLGGVALAASGAHPDGSSTTAASVDPLVSLARVRHHVRVNLAESKVPAGSTASDRSHAKADCTAELAAVQGNLLPSDQASGLGHALQVVEANCEKNPQAPGLVVALDHLVTNFERQAAHQAEKAAEVHGNAGQHGRSDEHGRPAQHGQDEVHGHAGGSGRSAGHGH
jgi:hypothetical protein